MLNNKNHFNLLFACIMLIALFTGVNSALSMSTDQKGSYYKSSKSILAEVSKRGASAIVSDLNADESKWNFVLRHIAKGTKGWLQVATALYAGSDAATSEMLNMAVGEALEKEPANVFRVTLPEFQLESICSGPDIDDSRFNSYDLAMHAIARRQKRISAITDYKLNETGNKCIELLEESKARITEFYK